MSEAPQPQSVLETSIHQLAQVVREAEHLEPEAQRALADLVDELSKTLHSAPLPPEETARLAETATHLAQALQERQESTLLSQATRSLEEAVYRFEARAPLLAGVTRRLLDALANLGI